MGNQHYDHEVMQHLTAGLPKKSNLTVKPGLG